MFPFVLATCNEETSKLTDTIEEQEELTPEERFRKDGNSSVTKKKYTMTVPLKINFAIAESNHTETLIEYEEGSITSVVDYKF